MEVINHLINDGNEIVEGHKMYNFMSESFEICRSITGKGVRDTLSIIQRYLPELVTYDVPTGTKCMDWEVPYEWNINDAYILDEEGRKIVDFKKNNLHVVGYSEPVDREMSLSELDEHLFSLPEHPNAIPYITSYYEKTWGFCISHFQRQKLKEQKYHVFIDSELNLGNLTYADFFIRGKSEKLIFVSTYICHPSMANNELSGPALATILASKIKDSDNYYSYCFVYAPEAIGAIVYLSRHFEYLRENTVAAFNLTCVGDNRAVSFLPSLKGDTLADRIARHVLKYHAPDYKEYSFLHDRGSDERQYCSPGVGLPMVSIMRSMYGTYPEYHTSLDDLSFVSPEGLQKSFNLHRECIKLLESNKIYQSTHIGEPQLVRRGLIKGLSDHRKQNILRKKLINFLIYCDGKSDLITISEKINVYAGELSYIITILLENSLIREVND